MKAVTHAAFLWATFLLAGCVSSRETTPESDVRARAKKLAHECFIIDAHIDLPYRLSGAWRDLSQRGIDGDFDYPRAREGELGAAFLSIYTPPGEEPTGRAFRLADSLIDLTREVVRQWPDNFALVQTPDEISHGRRGERVLFCLGMENGAPIQGSLEKLVHFRSRGVTYVTLCHNRNNHICDSSGDTTATWNGLSPFGKELVASMNRLGMMIDVSHASDQSVEQVLDHSMAPIIASHSGCRALTPGFNRNLPDDLIRRIARAGGVVHVGFSAFFLANEYRALMDSASLDIDRHFNPLRVDPHDPAVREYVREYWASHDEKKVHGCAGDVARHIDHIVKIAGVDHVGLGSDFDGSGDSLPTDLKDVSQYPNLIAELIRLGYSDSDITKICGGNTLRVWRDVLSVSKSLQQ